MMLSACDQAIEALSQGQVIAYPTESVYGFGCDPFNQQAIEALIQLKGRAPSNPFILIASQLKQIEALLDPSKTGQEERARLLSTTNHPTTWVCPASDQVPEWLLGPKHTIAIRITQHPIAKALCDKADQAIISSSANISGEPPAKNFAAMAPFQNKVAVIVDAPCGDAARPSTVVDLITQHIYRL